jgi:hypothetical protein
MKFLRNLQQGYDAGRSARTGGTALVPYRSQSQNVRAVSRPVYDTQSIEALFREVQQRGAVEEYRGDFSDSAQAREVGPWDRATGYQPGPRLRRRRRVSPYVRVETADATWHFYDLADEEDWEG